jgi:hypothetical protein
MGVGRSNGALERSLRSLNARSIAEFFSVSRSMGGLVFADVAMRQKRCSANVEKGVEGAKHCRVFQRQQLVRRLGFADAAMGQELQCER